MHSSFALSPTAISTAIGTLFAAAAGLAKTLFAKQKTRVRCFDVLFEQIPGGWY